MSPNCCLRGSDQQQKQQQLYALLTPCSLTPVAPHFGVDTGFFWYWYVNRPPVDHNIGLQQQLCAQLLS